MITFAAVAGMIVLLLLLEGFFSGSEMAIIAADRQRIKNASRGDSLLARLTLRILAQPSWYLSTCLSASNLAEVANASLLTSILVGLYASQADLYAFLILTPLILIAGEILPKTLFQQKADRWVQKVVPVIWVVSIILFPFVWLMSKTAVLMHRLSGLPEESRHLVTREELLLLLRTEGEHGDMKPMEKDMISRIFHFSKTRTKEVMIPLVDVVALDDETRVEEAVDIVRREGYSRYPVFHERVDNMVGLLHSFDLLFSRERHQTIRSFIHPISFFPESKPADELLMEMQRDHEFMGAVVDEYGGAVGIVTIEDILEEIVGEIRDEYDIEQPLYRKIGPRSYLINARMEIDHINEQLKLRLPKDDYETLGGFMLDRLGRVPHTGESFRLQGITFEVRKADDRSVQEVLITLNG